MQSSVKSSIESDVEVSLPDIQVESLRNLNCSEKGGVGGIWIVLKVPKTSLRALQQDPFHCKTSKVIPFRNKTKDTSRGHGPKC